MGSKPAREIIQVSYPQLLHHPKCNQPKLSHLLRKKMRQKRNSLSSQFHENKCE